MAVVIPAGIISAWLAVPVVVTDRLLQPAAATVLPVLIQSNEKNNYVASIRTNRERSQYQLELIQKEAFTAPSSLIYQTGNSKNELIGRIETSGAYYFTLEQDSDKPFSFILYDIIHKKVFDSIIFKTSP